MEEVRPTDRKERMKHHEQKNPKGSVYAYGTECLCPVRRKGKHQKEPDAESAGRWRDNTRANSVKKTRWPNGVPLVIS